MLGYKKRITIWIFAVVLVTAIICGCSSEDAVITETDAKTGSIVIKGKTISVELADTRQTRMKGLSGRRKLEQDSGMLFIFPDEARRGFWMKDCFIDLDIAFIDSKGVIMGIQTMRKQPENIPDDLLRIYSSKSENIRYVLEMNAGWFKDNQVNAGDKIELLQ